MIFLYRLLYQVGFLLFSMVYLPVFILKGKMGEGVGARFGYPPAACLEKLRGGKVVWLHAVSVGEMGLAVRLAAQLKLRMPEAKILFTTTTVTAYGVASKIVSEEDALCYFPIDWPWSVASFIKRVSPSLVLLFETEIWPNLIDRLAAEHIPVYIVNGRISDKALRSYRKVKGLLKYTLAQLSGIGVQDETMMERYIELGAPAGRVRVTGNLKFEWSPGEIDAAQARSLGSGRAKDRFTWLCVSTHEGEETLLTDTYLKLRERYPIHLVLAPRHVDRATSIEKMVQAKGIKVRRYSAGTQEASADAGATIDLIDVMGVLPAFYPSADAVFVGGSLVPVGGHNPVEPAYFGKPIITGPYMQNFRSMVEEFEKNGAIYCAKDKEMLEEKLVEWMGDGHKRVVAGDAARQLIGRHRGATQKNLDYVLSDLEQSLGRRLQNV